MLALRQRRVGAVYRVEPVQWGGYALGIECVVRDEDGYTVRLRCMKREAEETVKTIEDQQLQQLAVQECEWEGRWGEERTFLLPYLTRPF